MAASMEFLRAVYQCRELRAAVLRFSTPSTLHHVDDTIEAGGLAALQAALGGHQEHETSDSDVQVATLVLKDLESEEFDCGGEPTPAGDAVLRALQAAVFGPGSLGDSLMHCVYATTFDKARQARTVLAAALLDALRPSNCLSLLRLGQAAGCRPLAARARECALRSFPAAAALDRPGLVALSEPQLMDLLCSDDLQAGSEVEVFGALAAWTQAEPARGAGFASRMARALRLQDVPMAELALLDAHPLVGADRLATMIVANTYLSRLMGIPHEPPFGLATVGRPRRQAAAPPPQRGEAAAGPEAARSRAAPELDCGAPAHSGRHASVFEAVLCGLAARHAKAGRAGRRVSRADVAALAAQATDALHALPRPAAAEPAHATRRRSLPTPSGRGGGADGIAVVSRRSLFGCPAGGTRRACSGSSGKRARGGSPNLRRASFGVGVEMQLSPTRCALRDLATMGGEPPAAQDGAAAEGDELPSRKRLRFE